MTKSAPTLKDGTGTANEWMVRWIHSFGGRKDRMWEKFEVGSWNYKLSIKEFVVVITVELIKVVVADTSETKEKVCR